MKKVKLNDTYAYEDFISESEQKFILDWIEKNENIFIVNETAVNKTHSPYGGRKFYIVKEETNIIYNIVKKIKERVIDIEDIKEWVKEPNFYDMIGINGEGGSIHVHTDPNLQGYTHVRYNVILRYPQSGGHSIYNGKINVLKEKMVWRCVAGQVKHGSVPTEGKIPRITLSLGFQIKNTKKKFLI